MSGHVFEHDSPDRFIPGTVGMPGGRTFYLQAVSDTTITSVLLEKEQVEMLGERINELLDTVRSKSVGESNIPVSALPDYVDNSGLTMPVDAEFRVGTMSLGWDTRIHRLVIECFELSEADREAGISAEPHEDSERDVLRVTLDAVQAREFARHAELVVNAGRADCPFCSLPLDTEGHVCPRANGVAR